MFGVIGAMAEFERALIQERIRAGIRAARARGKRLGRPREYVNTDRLLELKSAGMSLRQIANALGIGYGTVRDRLAKCDKKAIA